MVFQSSTIFKQQPHATGASVPFVGGFDFVLAPPSSRQEPINVIDVEACCTSYHGLCLQDAHEVSKMLSSSEAWGALDELEDSVWMKGTRTGSAQPSRQTKVRSKTRTRVVKCADEVARRHAHRRSLQKGYERDYRERKRQNRDFLRQEWFRLEQKLKITLVSAQNKAIRSSVVAPTSASPTARGLEELRGEARALGIENLVLQCALSSEERLADAQDYFTQSLLRQRLNQTSGTPWLFQFEFSWQ